MLVHMQEIEPKSPGWNVRVLTTTPSGHCYLIFNKVDFNKVSYKIKALISLPQIEIIDIGHKSLPFKGSFYSESAIRFSNLQTKYSKSLSWAWNLNKLFTVMVGNSNFKFRIVIWNIYFGDLKNASHYQKKATFKMYWKIIFSALKNYLNFRINMYVKASFIAAVYTYF